MTTIIPIPAFRDNYIWAVRNGRIAAVVDPGDAAPVLAWLDDERRRAVRDPRHASPCRPRRRRRRALRALRRAGVRTCARDDSAAHARARRRRPHRRAGRRPRARDARHSRPHGGAHRVLHAGRDPLLFCGDTLFAAGCGRLFEGTPEQMWTSLSKLAALPPAHARLLRARIHAREPALRRRRSSRRTPTCARGSRASGRSASADVPTLPSTIGDELATNPFLRAALPAVMARASAHAGRPMDGRR